MKVFDLIKEKLEKEKSDWNDDYNVPINKAISIVDEVEKEYNNGWIDCKKELPKITNLYLVTKKYEDRGKSICETGHEIFWIKDNKWDCERDEDYEWKVIAWRNRLAPYKEVVSDEK